MSPSTLEQADGRPMDSLDGGNSFNSTLPTAQTSAGDENCSERTPAANPTPEGALPNVLSPSAPMNLFSPTVGAESVVSPTAASSYAEAAEALGLGTVETSETPSPINPLASGDPVACDVLSDEHQEQQLDGVMGDSDGGAR